MTRLDLQIKLIAKYGNTLSKKGKERFEGLFLGTLRLPKFILDLYTTTEVVDEQEVKHQRIGSEIKAHQALAVPLFNALRKLGGSAYKNEVLGDVACYAPALMDGSDTTVCFTSWGLAFRFDQELALSDEAAQFFIDEGFKTGIDKDGLPYFIWNAEKLIP